MVQFVSQACPRRAIEPVPKGPRLRDVRPNEPNPDRLPAKGVVGIERAGAVHGAPLHARIEIGDWGVRPSATRFRLSGPRPCVSASVTIASRGTDPCQKRTRQLKHTPPPKPTIA